MVSGTGKSGTSLSVREPQHVSEVTHLTLRCEFLLTTSRRTNHAIGVDQLISAAEALRVKVRRDEVLARRTNALKEID